ncbi:hypothetical protein Tco_0518024 [Tanacetum coccineum]
MSAITDIKCALTRKALDAFCTKYHIPEEVHVVLPNQNDTMHERPTEKIGLYTRFVDYANFRLPLSTFLVDILRHFRINISQLSVIEEAKNDHFFWVDAFACPALFPWHTAKNVTRDPAPVATDFNAQDYATLVAHPSPFRKFPEAFLCLVGLSRYYSLDEETYPRFLHKNGEDMDIFAFIHTPDPTKVKIVERERNEDEPLLLQTTVGRTVPLLPVAPDRAESELEASVDRLFDEGGSGNQTEQGGSAGSGRGADIQLVSEATDTVAEDVAPLQPRCQRKRKTVVVDAGEASHPPKKLREDHGTPSGPSVAGKSRSAIQRLLVGAVLNPDVGVAAMPTLPFITSSVSATPEHESGDHIDSVTGLNLGTIGASQRSSVPVMMTVTTVTLTVDPAAVAKEKPVEPSLFSATSLVGGTDPTPGGFSDHDGSDFLVGGIRTVIDPDTDLQKTYVPRWSVTNGFCLDDGRVCREMVDEFAPPKFFAYVCRIEHDQLFTEFNVGAARQMSLSAKVRMRAEYNIKEKRRLKSEAEATEAIRLRARASKFEAFEKSLQDEMKALHERNTTLEKENNDLGVKVIDLAALVAVREREVADLDTLVTSFKSQNDKLMDRVHELEVSSSGLQEKVTVYEDYMGQLEKFQDDRMKEMASDPSVKLAITKCLNSPEYLSALGEAIGKAIEKGMQDGLSAGITHGKEGRVLTDVAAYNPSAEDASIEAVMNVLRLEEPLADKLGLNELQPYVDQLMVPIHHSPDKVVIGATALSLALDVSSIRVRKIKENIANQRSVLHDVFVPLSEPFSAAVLTGTEGTSDTTTTLSTTFASASTIAPISVDDYEVVGTDDQAGADGNAEPFPNVDDAELNIP